MATRRISVSELKWVCLNETYKEAWTAGRKLSTFQTSSSTEVVHGTRFHHLVEAYITRLSAQDDRHRYAGLERADTLWHDLYDHLALPRLNAIIQSHSGASAYRLARSLQAFCAQLEALRKQCVHFSTWQDVYVGHELTLKDVPLTVGRHTLLVSGQVDALRFHPAGGVEVVDYKLVSFDKSSEARDSAAHLVAAIHAGQVHTQKDLVQLAVYAHLLKQVKPAIPVEGVLEYYTPELETLPVSAVELQYIFESLVAPVLPQLFGDRPASKPKPAKKSPPVQTPKLRPKTPPTPDHSEAIEACFATFKLPVRITGRTDAPQLVRYRITPEPGIKVVSLAGRAEDLQVALSLPMPPVIRPAQGCVILDIAKEEPQTVGWEQAIAATPPQGLCFPLGVGVDGEVVTADLGDPGTAHALIAGASGSGKSEWLKSTAAALIRHHTPRTLQLTLIDPKILTFSGFATFPHLAGPIITGIDDAIDTLEKLADAMDRRYRQLHTEGFSTLSERFSAGRTDLPYHVVIFDEFGDLVLSGREAKKHFETLVTRIAQKGRAAGIHMLLSTQRPDRTIVTGAIKANLPLKICLKVTNATNSKIVLDEPGGESLLGRGDLLYDKGRGIHRAQSPLLTSRQLLKLLRQ